MKKVILFLLLFIQAHSGLSAQTRIAVEPRPALTVGDVLGTSPDKTFTDISAIVVVGDSILVLEGDACEIRVFDHQGRFLGRFGRKGEGPGEFQWPTAMRRVPEGLSVIDLRLRRQSFFTLNGELIRTEPLGHLGNQGLAGSAVLRGGVVVAETSVSISSDAGAFPERLVVVSRPEAPRPDTIARYSTGYVPFRLPDSYGFLGARVGSEGDWAVAGDSVLAVISGEPGTLRWWSTGDGRLVPAGDLELPFSPEPLTRDDVRDLIEQENRDRRTEGEGPLPRSVEMDAPQYWGQVKQLVIGDDDECWIQWDQPRSDQDDLWFRVNLASRHLERTRLPNGFRMLTAQRGNLYGYMVTEYDTPELTVYRLRRSGSE